MRTLLAFAALLVPAAAWAAPISALWVPAGAPDASALEALLARRPELRLAVALASEDLASVSTGTLAQLWEQRRIEPVLRLAGDPILPLLPAAAGELRPRLAVARQAFQRAFGRPVESFAAGGGALGAESLRVLAATGLVWTAAGASSTTPFRQEQGLTVFPAQAAKSSPAEAAAQETLLVFDEASGLLAQGSALSAIEATAERAAGAREWALPSERLGEAARAAAAQPAGLSWAGDLGFWNGRPAQTLAVARLAEAGAELERYQNSGAAALEVLDQASALLRQAEASRRLASAEALETETVGLLIRFYRLLGRRPPEELVSSVGAAGAAGLVAFEAGPGKLAFRNPSPDLGLGDCALESLEVSFQDQRIDFAVTLASNAGAGAPPEVDVYVDVNHRQGVGSSRLLPGQPGFVRAADAWEFALAMTGEEAQLYRFVPPKAAPLERLPAEWDPALRVLRSSIPAARIKGRPGSWGYLTLCVRTSGAESRVLGALASRDEQRQLDDPKRRRRARFSAQRLPPREAALTRPQN